jgi:hypothetical protein
MKTTTTITLACLIAAMTACGGPHRGPGPNTSISERRHMQRGNIREGVREGDLTRHEANELRARQRDVQRSREQARRDDGYVDRQERRRIKKKQRRLGNEIYEERHDGATR